MPRDYQPTSPAIDLASPTLTSLPQGVINASEFKAANRANGHPYDDPFYIPPSGSDTPKPGILLKVENITDMKLYTIPPSLSMSCSCTNPKLQVIGQFPYHATFCGLISLAVGVFLGLLGVMGLVAWATGKSSSLSESKATLVLSQSARSILCGPQMLCKRR